MKDKIEFDNILLKEIYTSCYSVEDTYLFLSYRELLCYGGNFSNITFTDDKIKCGSPYPLDFSWPYL